MLFVGVGLYFACACILVWLLLFARGREMLQQTALGLLGAARLGLGCSRVNLSRAAFVLRKGISATGSSFVKVLLAHPATCCGGAALLAIPAVLVGLYDPVIPSPPERVTAQPNGHVAQLLIGEHLAAPPPLPPLIFSTPEVVQVQPTLKYASRDWSLLDSGFAQRLLQVFKIMREVHGYEMVLLEGYRSPERQNQLLALGPRVTKAGAYHSYHQFGLAADAAFLKDGKLVISEKDPWAMRGYQLYGEVAESLGLRWGGRWAMRDLGHTEWQKATKNKYVLTNN